MIIAANILRSKRARSRIRLHLSIDCRYMELIDVYLLRSSDAEIGRPSVNGKLEGTRSDQSIRAVLF